MITEGKLFAEMRDSAYTSIGHTSYEDMLPFLRFLDKYVSKMVGRRELDNYFKCNNDKTLLDRITPSDIAYTMLLCENSHSVWDENEMIKITCATPEEKKKYVREATQKYHVKRGVRLVLYGEGWTKEGRDYYDKIMEAILNLKNTAEHWDVLKKYCADYAKENRSYCFERNGAPGRGIPEDGAGDEDSGQPDDDGDGFELSLPGDQVDNATDRLGLGGNTEI